jgi:hypothetical protein
MRATSPALAMHKHTARLPACSAVVGIANGAEALDTRAPSRRYGATWLRVWLPMKRPEQAIMVAFVGSLKYS